MTQSGAGEDLVAGLIGAVTRAGDESADLAGRRAELVIALGALTRSDFGFWCWGRGHHPSRTISPVAIVPFGFDDVSFARFVELALSPATIGPWRERVNRSLGGAAEVTHARTDLYPDAEWEADPFRDSLHRLGMDEWVHALRYSAGDTWSNVFVTRRRPASTYTEAERDLIGLAMRAVPWLHATADEVLPRDAFKGLTPRQRSILVMLLDGMARKAIASRLGIAEDTVGEHVKALYRHFGVNSIAELAGMFLKGL